MQSTLNEYEKVQIDPTIVWLQITSLAGKGGPAFTRATAIKYGLVHDPLPATKFRQYPAETHHTHPTQTHKPTNPQTGTITPERKPA